MNVNILAQPVVSNPPAAPDLDVSKLASLQVQKAMENVQQEKVKRAFCELRYGTQSEDFSSSQQPRGLSTEVSDLFR